jgi:regulator of sigma E protease
MLWLSRLAHDPLAIVLAIVALGVLIIVHEGGHYLVARWSGMRVDRFSIGFGPPIARFQRGETTFQIGLIPLGGFVQIAGLSPGEEEDPPTVIERDGKLVTVDRSTDPRLYSNRPVWQRMATIFAGPGTNYVFAAVAMMFVFTVFGEPLPKGLPMVLGFSEGSPAQKAGMQLQDEVVSVDGKPVKHTADVSPIVNAAAGRAIEVVVQRPGEERRLQVTPAQIDGHWRIGIMIEPREEWTRTSIGQELKAGLLYPVERTVLVFQQFAQIFKGKQEAKFSGPIGIVGELKRQILRGTPEGLSMVAFISVLLGLFNLFPLPALDGGRLVFLGWELISRRRVNQRVEAMVHMVGMLALLSFILYVSVANDIGLAKYFKR